MSTESYHSWYAVQIRFRDLDPLAHVNNTVYFIYLEEARSYYFDQLKPWLKQWPSTQEQQQGEASEARNPRIQMGTRGSHYGILVKEITCTYQLPLVHSDHAEVGSKVVKVGNTSFIMEHEIRDSSDPERIFAIGRTVLVWCNYQTGRPHPVPVSLRTAFERMEGFSFMRSN